MRNIINLRQGKSNTAGLGIGQNKPRKTRAHPVQRILARLLAYLLIFGQYAQLAHATDLSNVPMAVENRVIPNVLTILDNSESMDAYMSGMLVSGTDPNTRGNIGRQVIRDTITAYRSSFNWGLMSYGLSGSVGLYNTYAYYLGSNITMVFTDDCVAGISASNGNRRCVGNPQPFSPGGAYVTYDVSGDDPNIQDVLYDPGVYTSLWGLSPGSGTNYNLYLSHNTGSGNSWSSGAFSGFLGTAFFTPTDAGFLSNNPPYTRQLYLPRAQGYLANITGAGVLNEPVMADSTTHFNNLMANLASETLSTASGEIKNAAVFTPNKGALDSAKSYFQGSTSPITQSCQKNFVMLVTDGLPTGDTTGNLYSAAARTNTYNSGTNTWTFGQAAQDAINSVTALRTTTKGTTTYNIATYVVGLGDTVNNANAIAVMNAMASAGSTGSAYLANNAAAFRNAISSVVSNIVARTGAAAAVAVANANVTPGDNASYASSYDSGTWTGDLQAYPIDLTTGQPNTAAPIWASSAQTQLDAMTPSNRKIISYSGTSGTGQGIQFQPTTATTTTKLSATQQANLNTALTPPGPSDGAAVVAYLRGDRSGEASGTYRLRAHLLGDIVNAEPVIVREPLASFTDAGYSAYKTQYTTTTPRTKMVYQGTNDGMLHAFNAATGAEQWAYVPNLLLGSTINLNNLSQATGFNHKYYVDGTPTQADVDFSNTNGVTGNPAPDWHTIIVGGLSKGGRGYYALDVTTPVPTSEAAATSMVMWEFPNSATSKTVVPNIGYSYGRPVIVKTAAAGWVALVTSGYNNGTGTDNSGGDGGGYLFVLNAKTGDLINAIPTLVGSANVGTAANPSGLAQISAFVQNGSVDMTVDYAYGGDLLGNVWRFDLTGNNTKQWSAKLLATLVDGAATPATQPVTTAPELASFTVNGVLKRMVYVGTGQYLGDTDIAGSIGANSHATQTQTIYGLVDDTSSSAPLISPLRSNLQQQTLTTSGSTRTASNLTVDYSVKKGWYMDLPVSGERLNTDPVLALGALNFTTNVPSTDVCNPGGSSFFNVLDYKTGGFLTGSTISTSSVSLGNVLASRPILVKLPSGNVKAIVRKSDATTVSQQVPVPPSSGTTKRISWRELLQR